MLSKRTNGKTLQTAYLPAVEACFDAMQRHHARGKQAVAMRHVADIVAVPPANGTGNVTSTPAGSDGGDILYGAMAIARFMFPLDFAEHPRRARRRVFNLWAFYEKRKERSGFLKLKGALCLSKAQWRRYHGLD